VILKAKETTVDMAPEISNEMLDAFQDAWEAHNNVHRVGDEHGELLSDGTCCDRAGLLAVVPKVQEEAYRAGQEDAARELPRRLPTKDTAAWLGLVRRVNDRINHITYPQVGWQEVSAVLAALQEEWAP
jgi:hypothetical protein